MELGTASFLVGFPVISEGKPQGHEENEDDDDGGNSTAKGGPVKLEPYSPRGLIDVPKLVAIGLAVLVCGRLF